MADISNRSIGTNSATYTLSILPMIPYMKIEGLGPEGVQWDAADIGQMRMGADGLAAKNQRAALYTGTLSLQPNSNLRTEIQRVIDLITPKFGKSLVDYNLTLIENNFTTSKKTVWSNGMFIEDPQSGGLNYDQGQGSITLRMQFNNKVISPL